MKVKVMLEIESHIENPDESELFAQAPSLKKESFIYRFVTGNLRIITMGADNSYQFEDLVNKEIPPIIVEEYMRKCIPDAARPTFQELDNFISGDTMKIVN